MLTNYENIHLIIPGQIQSRAGFAIGKFRVFPQCRSETAHVLLFALPGLGFRRVVYSRLHREGAGKHALEWNLLARALQFTTKP